MKIGKEEKELDILGGAIVQCIRHCSRNQSVRGSNLTLFVNFFIHYYAIDMLYVACG